MREYPDIQLDVAVVKMPTDIVGEGFDAGIRFGEQIDHDMITMRVMGEARFLVVASPGYLKERPRPKTLRDLRHHDCIRNRLPNGAIFGWDFERNGRTQRISVNGRLIVNDIELSIRAVRDGLGLAYLIARLFAADLKAGRLVPLLQEWSPKMSGFFLYHPSRRQVSGPLKAFISFLKVEAAAAAFRRQHRPAQASIQLIASSANHGDKGFGVCLGS